MTQQGNPSLVSQEHQYIVIGGLLKSSYLLSMIESELNDSYFTDASCKVIFKSLVSYYKKYQKLPGLQEIIVEVENNYIDLGTDLGTVKDVTIKLFNADAIDEDYLTDKVTELIKKVRVNRTLSKTLEMIKNGTSLDNEKLAGELVKSLEVSLCRSGVFCLGDSLGLNDARKSAVGDNANKATIKSVLPSINASLQYKAYQKGTLNLIVSPPGTGKTSYLINEGAYAAMQGFNVLHVFLGDMVHYDGFIRYSACISGTLQDEIVAMTPEQQFDLINKCNSTYPNILNRIQVLAYGAGEVTVDQLIENIKRVQDKLCLKFDMIIIDYADNLDKNNSQMYTEGGLIYDRLALFARVNSTVMMVASQPKIGYWNQEIIPLEGAAESSKKQHVVDMMMTFNLVARDCKIGTFFIPKVRRGISGRLVRVETAWEKCRLEEITEDQYTAKKGQLGLS